MPRTVTSDSNFMRRAAPVWWMLALTAVVVGCAISPRVEGPTADCPVCAEEGDLACLHVHITDSTARASYNDKTYYFCSDACKEVFLKAPAKYAH